MKNNILLKVLIIGVPTYTVAIATEAMVFTMPMLAITTVIATNLFDDAKENENRVDEGDAADGGDIGDLDGWFMQLNPNPFKHRRKSEELIVVQTYSVTVE